MPLVVSRLLGMQPMNVVPTHRLHTIYVCTYMISKWPRLLVGHMPRNSGKRPRIFSAAFAGKASPCGG